MTSSAHYLSFKCDICAGESLTHISESLLSKNFILKIAYFCNLLELKLIFRLHILGYLFVSYFLNNSLIFCQIPCLVFFFINKYNLQCIHHLTMSK